MPISWFSLLKFKLPGDLTHPTEYLRWLYFADHIIVIKHGLTLRSELMDSDTVIRGVWLALVTGPDHFVLSRVGTMTFGMLDYAILVPDALVAAPARKIVTIAESRPYLIEEVLLQRIT
jgi:hypothetical protein